ncbi:MAG: hypothetical protein OEV66_02420 [Spirochaetia bacterium]|nr:hypothetical protein [Spirochaetia bacterium]
MSKNNICRGDIQKKHRLKYLTFQGRFRENEKLRILRRGYFLTTPEIWTEGSGNHVQITWFPEKISRREMNDMWKKSNFKMNVDEIQLYEVSEKKDTPAQPGIPPQPLEQIEIAPVLQKPSAEAPEATEEQRREQRREQKSAPKKIPEQEINPEEVLVKKTAPEKSIVEPKPPQEAEAQPYKSFDESTIEFVDIQEMILDESGKPAGEFKPDS